MNEPTTDHPSHIADYLSSIARTAKKHKEAANAHKKACQHHLSLEVQSYRTFYWANYHTEKAKRHEARAKKLMAKKKSS
jgi:hypothetical protein